MLVGVTKAKIGNLSRQIKVSSAIRGGPKKTNALSCLGLFHPLRLYPKKQKNACTSSTFDGNVIFTRNVPQAKFFTSGLSDNI